MGSASYSLPSLAQCCNCRKKEAQDELRKKLLAHKEIDAQVRTLRERTKGLKQEYDKTEDDLKALQSIGQIIGEVLRQLDDERCEPTATPLAPSDQCLLIVCQAQPVFSCVACAHNFLHDAALANPSYHSRGIQNRQTGHGSHCAVVAGAVIVKASSGPRYVVGCRAKVDKSKLVPNTRVALDMTTLTIMRYLPREVCLPSLRARPLHHLRLTVSHEHCLCQPEPRPCSHVSIISDPAITY